jgi:Acyl-CoA reductase (LuxC)
MNFPERVQAIAKSAELVPWLGEITPQLLRDWVTRELGFEFLTSSWAQYGDRLRQLVPCSPILHVVPGETPHAGIQSLIRGILVGAENWVKLPASGLTELATFAASLPKELQPRLSNRLLPDWIESAASIVVFGSDATIREFANRVRPWQRFVPHGHKISFAIVLGDWTPNEVSAVIRDGSAFDQSGCLSPQFFLVKERAHDFAAQLARQLDQTSSRVQMALEIAAAIRVFREEWRFRTTDYAAARLWESQPDSLDWTVLFDPAETIPQHPLHRTFVIKPLTESSEANIALLRKHVSTIGIHPLSSDSIELAARWGAQRICPIGQMQEPALDWHHDGFPSLGSLVRVIDLETSSERMRKPLGPEEEAEGR